MSSVGEKTEEKKPLRREPRFYAVRTIGGREIDVALLIEARAKEHGLDIKSIIVPPNIKGIVLVEAPAAYIVAEAIRGIRYARSIAPGYIPASEIDKVVKEEIRVTIKPGDIVEIIAGPFRGHRARVERVDPHRQQVEVIVLDASFNLRLSTALDTVRPVRGETHGS